MNLLGNTTGFLGKPAYTDAETNHGNMHTGTLEWCREPQNEKQKMSQNRQNPCRDREQYLDTVYIFIYIHVFELFSICVL